jgi:hypothetical protein
MGVSACYIYNLDVSLTYDRYHDTKKRKRGSGDGRKFVYRCAQSEKSSNQPKAERPEKRARTTRRMDRFPCKGCLLVFIIPDEPVVCIHVKHDARHLPYCDISIPEHWKNFIKAQCEVQTPGQVSSLPSSCSIMLTTYMF